MKVGASHGTIGCASREKALLLGKDYVVGKVSKAS